MSARCLLLVPGLAAVMFAALSACAGDADSGAAMDDGAVWGGGGWGAAGTGDYSSFSGGAGGGGGVVQGDINIPEAPGSAQDSSTRFAYLCGSGECTPGGDPSECMSSGGTGSGLPSAPTASCQLTLVGSVVEPRCMPAGHFGAGDPCQTGADCASGLGCAAVGGQGGVCREHCCLNTESCAPGAYCDARRMAESADEGPDAPRIAVCMPAENCELLNDSTCASGLTCTIVRDDGTTSCVEPGPGRADDPCPCAPGFVCSRLNNTCKQLCRIDDGPSDCGVGAKCQGGSAVYPPGFGVCVGGAR
ncbi:hypothetical protein SOCE26_089090 [Sorangium cellulosum]|uniref:SRCR domain-containing protein n=1 Tax=Sorangium cellulosum TaxID=56 RepID=A0A2L0F7H5_SORCE|nr:hypothetical protein [Sorangium cellulosum]AUX47389.1 hypothetical protein SOCE26_089090 [Sorangium cellulosum]